MYSSSRLAFHSLGAPIIMVGRVTFVRGSVLSLSIWGWGSGLGDWVCFAFPLVPLFPVGTSYKSLYLTVPPSGYE